MELLGEVGVLGGMIWLYSKVTRTNFRDNVEKFRDALVKKATESAAFIGKCAEEVERSMR